MKARQQPPSPAAPARPGASSLRLWLFRLGSALGVPALLFIGFELVLRLCGYGYSTAFFIKTPVPGQDRLVENRQFSRRYFAPQLTRLPKPVAFAPAKPPQTLRVFVFGESAAEGDPAPAFGFARVLQVLLRDRYPDRRIEVINTAVTAINSHVVRPIAHEAAQYRGDVWVIYLGNNEVVGPFGSGTVFGAQAPGLPFIRASLAAKTTRTGQLLDSLLDRLAVGGSPRQWEGMEMFLRQQVRQDDPRMAAVYSHFERNLSDIVTFGARAGAKVIVATVGSNLRDCAPLASLHRATFANEAQSEWRNHFDTGVSLENQAQFSAAVTQYERAAQLDDQFADLQFRLARCLVALDRGDEARRRFTLARDLDTLRFRADSRINEIIRRVAGQAAASGVRLADVEHALARASADGIPGGEWFYEHVHFTFAGNCLVARELAEQIAQCLPNAAPPAGTTSATRLLSPEECASRLGLTDCDRWLMADEMWRRTQRPPFTQQLDHQTQMARHERIVGGLRQSCATNFPAAAAIFEQALARVPDDWQLHDQFAGALLQAGRGVQAAGHWRRVLELLPHRIQTYDLLGSLLLEQGALTEAESCYQQALRLQPGYDEAVIGLGRVRLAQHRAAEAVQEFRRAVILRPDLARTHNHLGLALLQSGQAGQAEAAFRAALRAEPDFHPARLNLSGALLAQGKHEAAAANYQDLIRANPRDATALVALGKALAKQGKTKEALGRFAEAVWQQPDDFEARSALGNALIRQNRAVEAAEHFAAATRLRPESAEAHLNYGSILASQAKNAEARAQFEEALRLKPDFAAAHLNLAIALAGENQLALAIAHLQEVLRFEPQNTHALRLLDTLKALGKAAP